MYYLIESNKKRLIGSAHLRYNPEAGRYYGVDEYATAEVNRLATVVIDTAKKECVQYHRDVYYEMDKIKRVLKGEDTLRMRTSYFFGVRMLGVDDETNIDIAINDQSTYGSVDRRYSIIYRIDLVPSLDEEGRVDMLLYEVERKNDYILL